ncbi:phosphopantetheine-binding protein [Nocardia sp. NPDC060256]|uniref:phosphopantetheine-binding protein n=1 Tax=unclassified Nocardia TaxID=2637762 RepID=UPI0036488E3C
MSDITVDLVDLVERVTEHPGITTALKFESLDNWTSLVALRLLTDIEDAFGVQLDLRAYLAVTDVGQLSALVSDTLAVR